MTEAHDLLKALAVVLGVSALTSTLSRRLNLPVVLGYVVAGIVIGPHVPLPLVANPEIVHTLSELGVTLLMFSLGMEFSFGRLVRVGPGIAITTTACCCLLLWLGFVAGRAFGWTTIESIFAGAILAISSTTIVAKAFEEQQITGRLRDIVVGALVVEDLIAVVLLAALTAIGAGGSLSAAELGKTAGRLGIFLVALIIAGMLIVPRMLRYAVSLRRAETTLIASIGLCFATALLAREMGYSVALGSFIAGSLVAESGEERIIAPLVEPVRDVFAAVFFVSVGMMIDPAMAGRHWPEILVLTGVVVFAKVLSFALGAFFAGNGVRTSLRSGMSLAQLGEFSFIIAALGVSLGATRPFIYPVAVAVSAITTLLTPWLIRWSDPVASWVDRKLPRPLQTFSALYGSWVERLRTAKPRSETSARVRRLARMLVLDTTALVALVVGSALGAESGRLWLIDRGLAPQLAWVIAAAAIAALGVPLVVGIIRVAGRLGDTIAQVVFSPVPDDELDLAAAPRRVLAVTVQLACVLLVGAPLVAITQPFLPGLQGAQILFVIVLVLGTVLWRSTRHLHGHVRAGAQVIVEMLVTQAHRGGSGDVVAAPMPLTAILDGLGEPVAIEVSPASPAVGKTLAQLNLRGRTGATVLVITRGETATVMPSAQDRLNAGDVLAVAGTRTDIEAARHLLHGDR